MRRIALIGIVGTAIVLGATQLGHWKKLISQFTPSSPSSTQTSSFTFTQYQAGEPVVSGVPLRFPYDHGEHLAQSIEWWYLTANLTANSGETFGAQWTLFRANIPDTSSSKQNINGDTPSLNVMSNPWWQGQLYFAHFALQSDTEHYAFERFGRARQVNIQAEPFNASIDDWSLFSSSNNKLTENKLVENKSVKNGQIKNQQAQDTQPVPFLPLQVVAQTDQSTTKFGINLSLDGSPIIAHGENGYSQKTPEGDASYYYSLPFLNASGALTFNGKEYQVSGKAWLDREWSGSLMNKKYTGWDWFSLQSDDEQSAIMAFCLRGQQHTYQYCDATYMEKNGNSHTIPNHDIALTILQSHQLDNRAYPVKWSLNLGDDSFIIEAVNKDSRNQLTFPYWEGRVTFKSQSKPGKTKIKTIQGNGYAELTGY